VNALLKTVRLQYAAVALPKQQASKMNFLEQQQQQQQG
jgi:hypothetical protein